MLNFSIQVNNIYIYIFFINIHISDTDSFYIQFEDYDWDKVLTILEDKIDFSNFEKSHVRYSSSTTDKTSPTVNSVYDLDRKTVKKRLSKRSSFKTKDK